MKIKEGVLKRTKKAYETRVLNLKDIKDIMNLQDTVYGQLVDKSKLERVTRSEFNFILTDNGLMIGIFVAEKLIAVRALLVPVNDPDHLGLTIGLSEAELDKVIYQEVSFVHPEYQGNGLQKIMAKLIMRELNAKDHLYSYVCATVAPDNIPSLKDKFSQEMELKALVTIYGDKQRYVFAKELVNTKNKQEIIKENYVELTNVNEAKRHLDLKWVGIELIEKEKDYLIKFVQYKS